MSMHPNVEAHCGGGTVPLEGTNKSIVDLLAFKALHIIGFVAWFAGLFYLPRLFVYHIEELQRAAEAGKKETSALAQQYSRMEWRLFKIIMRPAMILVFAGGIGMLVINTEYLSLGWMHIKLALVLALAGYNDYLPRIMRKLEKGEIPMSSERMRLFNEIPTLILVTIVLLAVFKGSLAWWKLILILAGLILFIVVASALYRRLRKKSA
ncbi:MAG: CopD family protein [Saprospiraceae bacterium]|nr:CopD family protein [Saprospiraceae bacterium]